MALPFLWHQRGWIPTYQLQSVHTPFGFIGSAGHARVRELVRNACPEKLKDKVERARGGEIGLDPKYEYFRYKTTRQGPAALFEHGKLTREEAEQQARENVAFFGFD